MKPLFILLFILAACHKEETPELKPNTVTFSGRFRAKIQKAVHIECWGSNSRHDTLPLIALKDFICSDTGFSYTYTTNANYAYCSIKVTCLNNQFDSMYISIQAAKDGWATWGTCVEQETSLTNKFVFLAF